MYQNLPLLYEVWPEGAADDGSITASSLSMGSSPGNRRGEGIGDGVAAGEGVLVAVGIGVRVLVGVNVGVGMLSIVARTPALIVA